MSSDRSVLTFVAATVTTIGAMLIRRAAMHTPPRARKIPHEVLFGAVAGARVLWRWMWVVDTECACGCASTRERELCFVVVRAYFHCLIDAQVAAIVGCTL